MNWENFRNIDGTFDFDMAYQTFFSKKPTLKALAFAKKANSLRPIKSRQVAAIILVLMSER